MRMSAAHAVDEQLNRRLTGLRTLSIGDRGATPERALRRKLTVTLACLDDVRTSHPLDGDGWSVPCTTPPGAAELSTIYGCHTRVAAARHLLGLYVAPLRFLRPPVVRGNGCAR
jgi:hypothetical protein